MSARGTRCLVALAVAAGLVASGASRGIARAQEADDVAVGDEPSADEPSAPRSLRVVVAGSPPFVVGNTGTSGLAVDLWTAIADELGVPFELTAVASVDEALTLVESGDADLAVGPISITAERAERVAFSQPYYQSHLSIAAEPERSWFDRVAPFMSRAFLSGLAGLLLILVLVGALVWLAERRGNPDHFPERPVPGIGNGVWMALVTMTTVGYGDRVPSTVLGRVVTGVWMLIAMLIAGSVIAFMSTALTLSQIGGDGISSADDLRSQRVAVVAGTTSQAFARRVGGRPVVSSSLDEAAQSVVDGRADAVVFDRPALQQYLREHPESPLVLTDARYEPTGYGFAFALDDPMRQSLDVAILHLQRTGRLAAVTERWLGPE